MDPRPSFSTRTNLWPVGYKATWQDDNLGSFQSEVMRRDDRGPLFSVTIKPAGKGEMARVSSMQRTVCSIVWTTQVCIAWPKAATQLPCGCMQPTSAPEHLCLAAAHTHNPGHLHVEAQCFRTNWGWLQTALAKLLHLCIMP